MSFDKRLQADCSCPNCKARLQIIFDYHEEIERKYPEGNGGFWVREVNLIELPMHPRRAKVLKEKRDDKR